MAVNDVSALVTVFPSTEVTFQASTIQNFEQRRGQT